MIPIPTLSHRVAERPTDRQIKAIEAEHNAAQELTNEEIGAASAAAEQAEQQLVEAHAELESVRKKAQQAEDRLRRAADEAAAAAAEAREWRQRAEEARRGESEALREAAEAQGAALPPCALDTAAAPWTPLVCLLAQPRLLSSLICVRRAGGRRRHGCGRRCPCRRRVEARSPETDHLPR